MKYLIAALLFFVFEFVALAQTNLRTVMVDTNGVVQKPNNFFSTNRIVQDIYFGSGQNSSTFGDIIYSQGTTRGYVLRGTILMSNNNAEYRLFNSQVGSLNSVGIVYFAFASSSGAAGAGNFFGIMRGDQGDNITLKNNAEFDNGSYWISFTTNLTITTGDMLTGNSTGATAKVWHTTTFGNSSRGDAWLYDVTGIFTTNDTNLQRNGTNTGVGIANSVWGASHTTNTKFFVYRTRDAVSNNITMPAIFNRDGTNRTAIFQMEAQ